MPVSEHFPAPEHSSGNKLSPEDLLAENRRLREQLSLMDVCAAQVSHYEEQRQIDAQRFRAILANNRSGILLISPAGTVLELVHSIFGYPRESLEGRAIFDLFHPESAVRLRADIDRVVQTPGSEVRSEYRLYSYAGEIRWLDATIGDRLDDPAIQALVVNYRDISEQKLVEQKLALVASIVESSDWAIVAEDFEGRVLSWNGGATTIYGYTAVEMLGNNIGVLLSPDQINVEAELRRTIREGLTTRSYTTTRRTKSGATIDVRLKLAPLRDFYGTLLGCSHTASLVRRDASRPGV